MFDAPMPPADELALEPGDRAVAEPAPPLCGCCDEQEQAHFWAKFQVMDTQLMPRLQRVSSGAFLCYRCLTVLLMLINQEVETTGHLGDICYLGARRQRWSSSAARASQRRLARGTSEPEGSHPPFSRSHSFQQQEHLCETCSLRLVHFILQRWIPTPAGEGRDELQQMELCYLCAARHMSAYAALGSAASRELADFFEITTNHD